MFCNILYYIRSVHILRNRLQHRALQKFSPDHVLSAFPFFMIIVISTYVLVVYYLCAIFLFILAVTSYHTASTLWTFCNPIKHIIHIRAFTVTLWKSLSCLFPFFLCYFPNFCRYNGLVFSLHHHGIIGIFSFLYPSFILDFITSISYLATIHWVIYDLPNYR